MLIRNKANVKTYIKNNKDSTKKLPLDLMNNFPASEFYSYKLGRPTCLRILGPEHIIIKNGPPPTNQDALQRRCSQRSGGARKLLEGIENRLFRYTTELYRGI